MDISTCQTGVLGIANVDFSAPTSQRQQPAAQTKTATRKNENHHPPDRKKVKF